MRDFDKICGWLQEQGYTLPTEEWVKQHLAVHTKNKVHVLHFLDPAFPALLKHVSGCPPVLYCKGDLTLVDKSMIGIVGARGASVPMVHFIKRLSSDLGKAGYVIVSGLAAGIVVAEAGFQSGSLITGQCAVEFNREVFVVPESPLDTRSRGGNKLIKEGAYLIENAEDITHILRTKGIEKTTINPVCHPPESNDLENNRLGPGVYQDDNAANDLTSFLSHIPISLDDLQQQTKLPMSLIRKELARLKIKGHITYNPNGQIALKN